MNALHGPGKSASPLHRCLVVDDEPLTANVVGLSLQSPGRRTIDVFQSSDDALAALESAGEAIDLLITDFRMPGMNGLELARRFRKCSPRTRIILMTGSTDLLPGVMRCVELDAVLPKPFSLDQLEATVGRVLAAPEMQEHKQ